MALSNLKSFLSDDSGAVTVDWVVLTAAIVGLGLAVMSVVSGGVENLSSDMAQALADTDPNDDTIFANNTDFTDSQ